MRKNYTSKYKAEAVLEVLREEKSLSEIAGRIEVHPNMLSRWKNMAIKELPTIFDKSNGSNQREHESQIQELYAQIGELSSKLNWLKKKSGIEL